MELRYSTNEYLAKLVHWFLEKNQNVAVALSGGVDSAVVALAAKEALGDHAFAITADYNTLSVEELSDATKVAQEIKIDHKVIKYNELENFQFVENDGLRCYHCRGELADHLLLEARKNAAELIVDGTHVDDLSEERPGIKALREKGIRSPMLEIGIKKCDIREIARECGLSIYDKPPNSCLASRIPRGTKVTMEKLQKIENSEVIVKTIFRVRHVRVRDHGDVARIEVGRDELSKLFDLQKLEDLDSKLRQQGFKFVTIDTRGYRAGNMFILDNK